MILEDVQDHAVEEENYFVSMTDMMVGLVFIFIIMLMYYALQFRDVTDQLTGADKTRTEILEKLEHTLNEKGVKVSIDRQNGVLHLPDAILFDSAKSDLKPEGRVAVGHLADALADILPCYTDAKDRGAPPARCATDSGHRIESLYVEGHTDADPFAGSGALADNWDLSVKRATNTYRAVTSLRRELENLCSRKTESSCESVLSVGGYGPQRLIDFGTDPASKAKNRRIDLRIIMVKPDEGEAMRRVSERLARS